MKSWTLCIFVSLCMSQAIVQVNAQANAQAKASTRTVKFSQLQSVGRIYQINSQDNWLLSTPFSKTFIGDAKGEIKVPADAILFLDLAVSVTAKPQLLDACSADAFALMRIYNFLESPDDIFFHLSKVTALKRIELINSEVSDRALSALKSSAALEHLNLTGSAVTGTCIADWKGLKKLRFLDLSNNPLIKAAFKNVCQIHSLEYLNLSRTRMQDSDMAALKGLTNLSVLRLRKNSDLSSKCLPYLLNFKKLRYLDIDVTSFKPHDLLVLKGLPIKQFDLPQNSLSTHERNELLQAFPSCTFSMNSRPALKTDDEQIFRPISR